MKTQKNKKILIVLAIAVILAVLAGWLVFQLLSPRRTTAYVFNNNYPAGTQVTSSMLTAVEVDSNLIVAGNKAATSDYLVTSGNINSVLNTAGVLRDDVHSGNIFTSSMLSSTGGNQIEMAMKTDAVAITVGANNITGVTPALAHDDRVNVYANYNDSTVLILQNQRVLSVSYDNGYISGVTLECTVEDSLNLIHAYTYGSIHLGLVNATGYQYAADDIYFNIGGLQTPQ